MSRFGALLATTVAVCTALGCAGAGVPEPTTYVIDLEPGTDFAVTEDALVFPAAGNEALRGRAVGDIVVCGHGAGFVRRVLGVTEADGAITVATEAATLADAIEDGTVDHHATPQAGKSRSTE